MNKLVYKLAGYFFTFHVIEEDLFGKREIRIEPNTNVMGMLALMKENDFFKKPKEEREKIFEQAIKTNRIDINDSVYITMIKS